MNVVLYSSNSPFAIPLYESPASRRAAAAAEESDRDRDASAPTPTSAHAAPDLASSPSRRPAWYQLRYAGGASQRVRAGETPSPVSNSTPPHPLPQESHSMKERGAPKPPVAPTASGNALLPHRTPPPLGVYGKSPSGLRRPSFSRTFTGQIDDTTEAVGPSGDDSPGPFSPSPPSLKLRTTPGGTSLGLSPPPLLPPPPRTFSGAVDSAAGRAIAAPPSPTRQGSYGSGLAALAPSPSAAAASALAPVLAADSKTLHSANWPFRSPERTATGLPPPPPAPPAPQGASGWGREKEPPTAASAPGNPQRRALQALQADSDPGHFPPRPPPQPPSAPAAVSYAAALRGAAEESTTGSTGPTGRPTGQAGLSSTTSFGSRSSRNSGGSSGVGGGGGPDEWVSPRLVGAAGFGPRWVGEGGERACTVGKYTLLESDLTFIYQMYSEALSQGRDGKPSIETIKQHVKDRQAQAALESDSAGGGAAAQAAQAAQSSLLRLSDNLVLGIQKAARHAGGFPSLKEVFIFMFPGLTPRQLNFLCTNAIRLWKGRQDSTGSVGSDAGGAPRGAAPCLTLEEARLATRVHSLLRGGNYSISLRIGDVLDSMTDVWHHLNERHLWQTMRKFVPPSHEAVDRDTFAQFLAQVFAETRERLDLNLWVDRLQSPPPPPPPLPPPSAFFTSSSSRGPIPGTASFREKQQGKMSSITLRSSFRDIAFQNATAGASLILRGSAAADSKMTSIADLMPPAARLVSLKMLVPQLGQASGTMLRREGAAALGRTPSKKS